MVGRSLTEDESSLLMSEVASNGQLQLDLTQLRSADADYAIELEDEDEDEDAQAGPSTQVGGARVALHNASWACSSPRMQPYSNNRGPCAGILQPGDGHALAFCSQVMPMHWRFAARCRQGNHDAGKGHLAAHCNHHCYIYSMIMHMPTTAAGHWDAAWLAQPPGAAYALACVDAPAHTARACQLP